MEEYRTGDRTKKQFSGNDYAVIANNLRASLDKIERSKRHKQQLNMLLKSLAQAHTCVFYHNFSFLFSQRCMSCYSSLDSDEGCNDPAEDALPVFADFDSSSSLQEHCSSEEEEACDKEASIEENRNEDVLDSAQFLGNSGIFLFSV